MKKAFALLAIAGLLAACNNKKEETKTEKVETVGPADSTKTTVPANDSTMHMDMDSTKH